MASDGYIGNVHWLDILVIALYLAGSLAVGIWTICNSKSNLKGFFLAGRTMVWWPIGMSLFASNIGANNFVGIAGSAAASGTSVVMFEWSAVFLLILLGWIFLPVYIASGIYTMPEYLQRRFGGQRLRIYLSIIQLTTYVFATLSVDLYSGSVFLQQTLGWNIYTGVAFLLAITVVFTAFGGLTTVILTDALAVIVMVIGGFVLCIIGFVEIGGFRNLAYKYMNAIPNTTLANPNTTCGIPRDDALHVFRDAWEADYPWLGTVLRTTFGALWYWCANQVLVQRALAAKNITHSKAGTILAAYLKLTPMFIMVLPGMISRALYPDEVGCADPAICESVCDNPASCSNIALPKLVVELLPTGFRGLLIASMIAAVISSLTSIFNSSSTLFTLDIYSKIRPKAGDRELLLFGKVFVVFLTAVAVMWIPMMTGAQGGEIFKYSTSITGYFGAPTCAMFILAMFWNGVTEPAAFWGMLIAQAWGVTRFILDFVYPVPQCGDIDDRPGIVSNFHSYYHTVSQIILAFVGAFIISLFTKPTPRKQLGGLTYWARFEKPWKDIMYEKHKAEVEQLREVKGTDTGETSDKQAISRNLSYIECEEYKSGEIVQDEKPLEGVSEHQHQPDVSIDEPIEDHESRMDYLHQTRFWKILVNVNAVIVMAVCIFLYGFFY